MVGQYESPKLRSIVAGVLATTLLLWLICSLGNVLKVVGAPFLFLPEQLGLIERVKDYEVVTIPMEQSPTTIELTRPGRYLVYTGSDELLSLTSDSINSRAKPWFKVQQDSSGREMPVDYIARGLRIYDTPIAEGRPVFAFEIDRSGSYTITHVTRRFTRTFVVPDYLTGKETTIAMAYVVQIVGLLLLVGSPWLRRAYRRHQRIRAAQQEKRAKTDDFWKREAQRRPGGRPRF